MQRQAFAVGAMAAWAALGLVARSAHGQHEPPATEPDRPQLRWDEPIQCLTNRSGQTIHAQCDDDRKVCLFHDGCFPGTSAARCRKLRKLKPCTSADQSYDQLVAKGMRFVRASAEAPPGWERDERGRVFQTHFDMNRRIWLGARWLPTVGPSDERREIGRVGFETGLRAELLSEDTRTRHRFRALEGEVTLNPLTVDATLFRYDSSRQLEHPLVRLTTFWPPERHDLYLNVGWWNEVMSVRFRPRASQDETHLRFAAAGLTTDLWHSADLADYLRLRAGMAFEDLYLGRDDIDHRLAMTPLAHLESDVIFDPQGMHRLTVATGYEAPLVWHDDGRSLPAFRHRFLNALAYELMVLAVNDQPLTVRASAQGGYRTDLVEEANGWEIASGLGLRMNLWAPAPDPEDQARIRRLRGP